MDLDGRDDTAAHAASYLMEAGWDWLDTAAPGELAMWLDRGDAALSFHYTPVTRSARLLVTFPRDEARGGGHCDDSTDLRIQASSAELLGLLCWLTSSQGDLSPDTAAEWLPWIAHLCPDTYAVVSAPGEPERLARVLDGGGTHVLH